MGRHGLMGVALGVAVVVGGCGGGADAGPEPPSPPSSGVSVSTHHPSLGGGWRSVRAEGVGLRVPGSWVRLNTSDCEFPVVRWGPADVDPCEPDEVGAALYGSSTFDAATRPGELTRGDDGVAGYVDADDRLVVYAIAPTRDLAEQVLASARPAGVRVLAQGAWRTVRRQGVAWRYPTVWDSADGVCLSSWARGGVRAADLDPRRRGGCWAGQRNVAHTSSLLLVRAPSRATAQLVLGSGRADQ